MNDISVEKCTNGNNSSLDALLIDVLRNDVIVRLQNHRQRSTVIFSLSRGERSSSHAGPSPHTGEGERSARGEK